MALQIIEKNNTYYLKGSMNQNTSEGVILYFENLIRAFQKVIVNIDGVQEIDKNGVTVFKKLFSNAFQMKKEFLVIGNGCKDIYDDIEGAI